MDHFGFQSDFNVYQKRKGHLYNIVFFFSSSFVKEH